MDSSGPIPDDQTIIDGGGGETISIPSQQVIVHAQRPLSFGSYNFGLGGDLNSGLHDDIGGFNHPFPTQKYVQIAQETSGTPNSLPSDIKTNIVKNRLGSVNNKDANNSAVVDINNAVKSCNGYNQSCVTEGLSKMANIGLTFAGSAAAAIEAGAASDIICSVNKFIITAAPRSWLPGSLY